jgi:hypothetical protein
VFGSILGLELPFALIAVGARLCCIAGLFGLTCRIGFSIILGTVDFGSIYIPSGSSLVLFSGLT